MGEENQVELAVVIDLDHAEAEKHRGRLQWRMAGGRTEESGQHDLRSVHALFSCRMTRFRVERPGRHAIFVNRDHLGIQGKCLAERSASAWTI